MGTVFTEITLLNAADKSKIIEGQLKKEEARSITVKAIVDTGAISLVINEETRQKLGLGIWGEKSALLANGQRVIAKETDPVAVQWKDRETACQALVIPDARVVLLGAIPLEGLDLMVDPVNQKLAGVHGDKAEFILY